MMTFGECIHRASPALYIGAGDRSDAIIMLFDRRVYLCGPIKVCTGENVGKGLPFST